MAFAVVLALLFVVFNVHKSATVKSTETFSTVPTQSLPPLLPGNSNNNPRKFTKPNYYGIGTWGRQYDSPVYYTDDNGAPLKLLMVI